MSASAASRKRSSRRYGRADRFARMTLMMIKRITKAGVYMPHLRRPRCTNCSFMAACSLRVVLATGAFTTCLNACCRPSRLPVPSRRWPRRSDGSHCSSSVSAGWSCCRAVNSAMSPILSNQLRSKVAGRSSVCARIFLFSMPQTHPSSPCSWRHSTR